MAQKRTRNGNIDVTITTLAGAVENVSLPKDSFLADLAGEYADMEENGTLVYLQQEGREQSLVAQADFGDVQLRAGDKVLLQKQSTKQGRE